MSQEIFCILNNMDKKEINLQLAMQCAPVITGIKILNLLIVQKENEKVLEELLARKGLLINEICLKAITMLSEKLVMA